jgi:hypothetical protein
VAFATFRAIHSRYSFLEVGDMDGSAVWRRGLKAIKEIRREEPKEGEAVN